MILIECWAAKGWSFRPFVVIPIWLNNTTDITKRLYLAHLSYIYSLQKNIPIVWCVRYLLDEKFRASVKLGAYAFELLLKAKLYGNNPSIYFNSYSALLEPYYKELDRYEITKRILEIKVKEFEETEEIQQFLDEEKVRYDMVYSNKGKGY